MTLVLLAAVTAIVLAAAFGGRPSTFIRPTLHRFGLLGIVLVALLTSALAKSRGVYAGWLVVAALALVWFTLRNRDRPGVGLAITGIALNVVVIMVNAGMPVSLAAVERAGVPLTRVPLDTDPLRMELTTETFLPWLGEAVPLALPIRPAVVSPGDLLLAAGMALFLFTGLTGFGRTVPERLLTKDERKQQRAARKAAEASAEGDDEVVHFPVVDAPAEADPAVAAHAGAAAPADAELGSTAWPQATEGTTDVASGQPAPASSTRLGSAEEIDTTEAAAVPLAGAATATVPGSEPAGTPAVDPVAMEQAAARKQVRRQLKDLKKQRRQLADARHEADGPPPTPGSVSADPAETPQRGRASLVVVPPVADSEDDDPDVSASPVSERRRLRRARRLAAAEATAEDAEATAEDAATDEAGATTALAPPQDRSG